MISETSFIQKKTTKKNNNFRKKNNLSNYYKISNVKLVKIVKFIIISLELLYNFICLIWKTQNVPWKIECYNTDTHAHALKYCLEFQLIGFFSHLNFLFNFHFYFRRKKKLLEKFISLNKLSMGCVHCVISYTLTDEFILLFTFFLNLKYPESHCSIIVLFNAYSLWRSIIMSCRKDDERKKNI